ncbi:MAG TPA: hypothetical protein PLJ73_00245, partial [Myxococcota bacterium]|nr:hypothetical protein [Myxococcota bacterium]
MDWAVRLPEIGDKIGGRFRIVAIKGSGPVGVVFKAFDLALDLPVAVKVFNPELFSSAFRELNLLRLYRARTLQDSNLVRIFEVMEEDGLHFVTSQLVEGMSLRAVLDLRDESGERFPAPKIRSLAEWLIDAVVPIHKQGIIHGNLKPENLFVLPDKLMVSDPHYLVLNTLVEGQEIPATDFYRGPEQLTEPRMELKQTDVYAVALIIGEILAINPVRAGAPLSEQIPRLTKHLDDVFVKATQDDPFDRYDSLQSFAKDLSSAFAKVDVDGLWVRRMHETGSFKALRIVQAPDGQPIPLVVEPTAVTAPEPAPAPEPEPAPAPEPEPAPAPEPE